MCCLRLEHRIPIAFDYSRRVHGRKGVSRRDDIEPVSGLETLVRAKRDVETGLFRLCSARLCPQIIIAFGSVEVMVDG